ncbi:MAG: hypothetical protein RIM84_15480 [Alphaproteobacteria bacterium]
MPGVVNANGEAAYQHHRVVRRRPCAGSDGGSALIQASSKRHGVELSLAGNQPRGTVMDTPVPKKAVDDRWARTKDRLAIAMVVVVLLILGFLMVDGAVMNFQCSFWDFITFECNRWDAGFKRWE